MTDKMFLTHKQPVNGIQEFTLNIKALYPDKTTREDFETRFSEFEVATVVTGLFLNGKET